MRIEIVEKTNYLDIFIYLNLSIGVPNNSDNATELDLDLLARQLWTIGDVNRLRLLELLPDSPDCEHNNNVSQLAEKLGLSQPCVSNHLARLRTLGIVRHRRMCRDVFYWIDREVANEIVSKLQDSFKR